MSVGRIPLAARRGQVALVDGVFDPLHPGHLAYFHEAASYGSLVCAVASDAHVRAKGREPLFDEATRAQMVKAVHPFASVTVKHCSTEELLDRLRPTHYIKGKDWEDRLPVEQLAVCARHGIQVVYTPTVCDSSTMRLRTWAQREAEKGLDALEAYALAQTATPPEHYDAAYFGGSWRGANPYTLEDRRRIEGIHPDLIASLWRGRSILDVGCGPGHLMALLQERGMAVRGIEPSEAAVALAPEAVTRRIWCGPAREATADAEVVICREVLEHLTVAELTEMVGHLFRLASHAVYITTRFHQSPSSVFAVMDEPCIDPSHITLLTQTLLRALCVMHGGRRNRDAEAVLDHAGKGRVLVYDV